MAGKLIPFVLALAGLGGGLGAGYYLRPPSDQADHAAAEGKADPADETAHAVADGGEDPAHGEGGPEYVKMNNQFVVPVIKGGRVVSLVVLSLSLEVEAGTAETVYQHEPKLRDSILQVLFDHANIGGFSGSFTDGANLVVLRNSLAEAAAQVLGSVVRDVLITDIARQDS